MSRAIVGQLCLTALLAAVVPVGMLVVEPMQGFGFLVITLLVFAPLCFAWMGYRSGRLHTTPRAWLVPLGCIVIWTAAQVPTMGTDALWYCGMYTAVAYVVLALTVVVRRMADQRKQRVDASQYRVMSLAAR